MQTENKVKPDRIVIQSKARGASREIEWFIEIEKAFLDGYRVAKTYLREDMSMRNFRGNIGRCIMYLEGTEPAAFVPSVIDKVVEAEDTFKVKEETEVVSTGKPENAPVDTEDKVQLDEGDGTGSVEDAPQSHLEAIEAIATYKELKEYASKLEIEVPSNLRNPAAVKKYLIETLSA